jgi:hypothetical protein
VCVCVTEMPSGSNLAIACCPAIPAFDFVSRGQRTGGFSHKLVGGRFREATAYGLRRHTARGAAAGGPLVTHSY